jgi:hypothetical protein
MTNTSDAEFFIPVTDVTLTPEALFWALAGSSPGAPLHSSVGERQFVVPLHRCLIGVANTSGSHASSQDRDGNQFNHPNHQHWPQRTGQDSEQLRPATVGQPIGRDQGADRGDHPSAQEHVQQHPDHALTYGS